MNTLEIFVTKFIIDLEWIGFVSCTKPKNNNEEFLSMRKFLILFTTKAKKSRENTRTYGIKGKDTQRTDEKFTWKLRIDWIHSLIKCYMWMNGSFWTIEVFHSKELFALFNQSFFIHFNLNDFPSTHVFNDGILLHTGQHQRTNAGIN